MFSEQSFFFLLYNLLFMSFQCLLTFKCLYFFFFFLLELLNFSLPKSFNLESLIKVIRKLLLLFYALKALFFFFQRSFFLVSHHVQISQAWFSKTLLFQLIILLKLLISFDGLLFQLLSWLIFIILFYLILINPILLPSSQLVLYKVHP